MKIRFSLILVVALMSSAFLGCEKVIDVDLNSTNPQVVLDADLTLQDGSLDVIVTRTADYFGTDPVTAVEDAHVILFDASGNPLIVPHLGDGQYTLAIPAQNTENFRLEATVDGVAFVAAAQSPELVEIVGLTAEESPFGGGFGPGGNSGDSVKYIINCQFQDPPGTRNYYRITYRRNGILESPTEIMVFDDNNFDGRLQEIPVQFGQQQFDPGDVVEVFLISTDAPTNQYYQSLSDLISSAGGPGGGSAAPGNPTGNWNGDALGHFAVTHSDTMTIVVP